MNYDSFQQVMNVTLKGENELSLRVGSRDVIMKHSGLTSSVADQFHQAVRKEHERQESERSAKSGSTSTPPAPTEGQATSTDQYRGGATSIEGNREEGKAPLSIRDLLQERYNKQRDLVEYLTAQVTALEDDLKKEADEFGRIGAALDAVGGANEDA